MRFVGIGDLHLDGPLIKYRPDLNELICKDVEKILYYAKQNGIDNVIFYGDICHRPSISMDAMIRFYGVLASHKNLSFHILAGNHDYEQKSEVESKHSLQMFQEMLRRKHLSHVRIYADGPETVEIDDEPVRFLPWPHTEAEDDCLHVIHIECRGSKYDSGRPVNDGAADLGDMTGVGGHLHQVQKVGRIHFSGTPYQTNFGETMPKYFHDGEWRNGKLKIKKVETNPEIQLHTIVIDSLKDLAQIPTNANYLCKVFVQKGVALEANAFASYPNVVKINSYRTVAELKTMIRHELQIENASFSFDEEQYVKSWLKGQKGEEKQVKKRALQLYREMRG